MAGSMGIGMGMSDFRGGLVNSGDPLELLSPDDWTDDETPGVTITPETITFDPSADGSYARQAMPGDVAGSDNPFYATITIDSITEGSISATGFGNLTAPGTYTVPLEGIGNDFIISSSLSDAVVSHVSLKLLNDNQLGAELITNGGFASGAGWVFTPQFGTPWTISGGALHALVNTDSGYATNTGAAVEEGALYKIQFAISSYVEGFLDLYTKTGPASFDSFGGDDYFEDGSYTLYLIASATGDFAFLNSNGVYDVDNVSLKKYTLPS